MRKYNGYEFRAGIEDTAKKITKSLGLPGIKIRWTYTTQTAGIGNNGTVYLADLADDAVLTHKDLLKYCGFVAHELCHWKFTNFNVIGSNEFLRRLHNAVEDAYIEHKAIESKLTGNVESLFTVLIDGMVDDAMSHVTDWSDPRQYPFALAVYLRNHAHKKVPVAQGLKDIFDWANGQIMSCQSSEDTLAVATKVYEKIMGFSAQNNDQQNQPQGDEAGGEGQGKGNGEKAPNGADTPLAGPAQAPTNPDDVPCGTEVEPQNKRPDGAKPTGGGTYDESTRLARPLYHVDQDKYFSLNITVPGKLRYNVKRMFDNSGLSEFSLNRKSGTVNVHALPTAGFSQNVFKRRTEQAGIDSAVVICLDVSASMFLDDANYERIIVANQTTLAMLDALSKAGVATCVLTFGTHTSVLKDWSAPVAKVKPMLESLVDGSSTNDCFAVRYAHKLLLSRNEQRKICIVITDGDGQRTQTRAQVESGKNLGITTLGIGIKLDVSGVYDQFINVQNLAELGNATFKNIKLAA